MKAEETQALASSNNTPGDAKVVAGVCETSNGESLVAKFGALEVEL